MTYPNLTITTEPLDEATLLYKVQHANGKWLTFTVSGDKNNSWVRDRLAYLNEHGSMEGY